VANIADGIKVACDFFSMTNLKRTQRIVGELRQQRLSDGAGDDVLQFNLTLWYAWVGLSRLATQTCSGDLTSPDSFYEVDLLADCSVDPNLAASAIPAKDDLPLLTADPLPFPAETGGGELDNDMTPTAATPENSMT
jgi:hypothetical protein